MEFMAIAMRWVRAASLKVYICDAFFGHLAGPLIDNAMLT
jgi:hypothetical protein